MLSEESIKSLLQQACRETNLPLENKATGKVRDWYSIGEGKRLLVTTDRLSAFDRILSAVPFKGQVLNQLSAWWFEQAKDILPNHLISIPDPNAAIVQEVQPIPVEVIVRGYITGMTSTALWYRYALGERTIYGYSFGEGLRKNEKLPVPIITPTTKGGITGHDERLTCSEVVETGLIDKKRWECIEQVAMALFERGQQVAIRCGLILVDTKYEFGLTRDGNVVLIDEVHTPDSSRYWRAESYPERFEKEQEPENFDKEFIRLAYIAKGYRGDGEIPSMSDDLWIAASKRYITLYEMLTTQIFIPGEYPVEARLYANLRKEGVIQ